MPGYNSKGARPAFPNHGGLQPKWFPPKSQRPFSQSVPNTSGFTPSEPSNQNPFHKGQVAWWDNLPPVAIPLVWKSQGLPPRQKSRWRKHTPRCSFKAPFTISSNAFRTQEWLYLARDDVSRLRETPPLVSFYVGWLVRLSLSSDWG
jgi:hypothetical protein